MNDNVLLEIKNRVGYITLNRPEKRNALNFDFVNQIKSAFFKAETNDECKVIVIKANGEAFCAGADLEYLQMLQTNTYDENLADSKNLMGLFRQIYYSEKVVISQVEGPAMAGGCGLASVCDFCFATPESKFAYTEAKIGFIPALVMVFLLKKIGEGRAKQLLLSAETINASEAIYLGLINYIQSAETIAEEVSKFAEKLCNTNSAHSMKIIKEMCGELAGKNIDDGLLYAAGMNAKARSHEDCKKGIAAFLNKEKIKW